MKATRLLGLGGSMTVLLLAQFGTWAAPGSPGANEAASLFANRVVEFHLQVAPAAEEALRTQPRQYVRATVRVGTNVFPEVGLHLKGHSTFQPVGRKPAVTLKFNEFRAGQRWAGLRKVHLNNPSRDPSYLCQYVGVRVSRATGVPCPQVGHARMRWNGRDLGLYVLV
jgi:spore coat protein CotH